MTTIDSPPVASPPASVEEIARRCMLEGVTLTPGEPIHLHAIELAFRAALLSDRAAMAERVAGLEEKNRSLVAAMDEVLRRERNASHADLDMKYDAEAQERRAEIAEERVAGLERERDDDKVALATLIAGFRDLADGYEARADASEAEVARLREALDKIAGSHWRAALTRPDEPTKET